MWSLSGGSPQPFVGHTGAIVDAAFSDDGARLATASADGTARVWTLATGTSVTSSCHHGPVVSVRFSPDGGSRVATASEDGTACVWSACDGSIVSLLRGHSDAVNTVRWSSDGRPVLTASADGTARLWDPILGKPVVKPLAHAPHSRVMTAELSSDGHRAVTANSDRTARIWRLPVVGAHDAALASATTVATLDHAGGINAAAFSADDARIATAGQDLVAKVWDASTGQLLGSFEHAGVVETLAFNRDGTRLVTGSRDGTTQIWDLSRHQDRGELRLDSPVHAIAVAPDGEVAVGRDDSRVTIARGTALRARTDHVGTVRAAAYSAEGSLVTASDDGNVLVWAGGKPRLRLAHDAAVRAVAISTDGALAFTACADGHLRSWSMRSGEMTGDWKHTVALDAVALSPAGDLLVALDDDGQVVVWRGAAQLERRKRTQSAARALAFSHDGRLLVVSGATDARIFEVHDGAIATTSRVALDGPLQDVQAVAFTSDDARVINALAISADGNTLWAGCERGDRCPGRGQRRQRARAAPGSRSRSGARDRRPSPVGDSRALARGPRRARDVPDRRLRRRYDPAGRACRGPACRAWSVRRGARSGDSARARIAARGVADPAITRVFALLERLASSALPVLITGETGVGKENAAYAVHHWSKRTGTFIAVNCAAIGPESLVESELFGHDKGAFTGAVSAKPGLFESAVGGTVFLDEVGELPPSVQAKLLRTLETRQIVRLGETRERPIDVRLVAATNRSLVDEVKAGRFRQDLYFRLGGATVILPPLRDRRCEIAMLAREFLAEACARAGRAAMTITPEAMQVLLTYAWPGNIRELKNTMEYVTAAAPDERVEPNDLPESLGGAGPSSPPPAELPPPAIETPSTFRPIAVELRELERKRMAEALGAAGGVKTRAAQLIGMPIRTFTLKRKQYKL